MSVPYLGNRQLSMTIRYTVQAWGINKTNGVGCVYHMGPYDNLRNLLGNIVSITACSCIAFQCIKRYIMFLLAVSIEYIKGLVVFIGCDVLDFGYCSSCFFRPMFKQVTTNQCIYERGFSRTELSYHCNAKRIVIKPVYYG